MCWGDYVVHGWYRARCLISVSNLLNILNSVVPHADEPGALPVGGGGVVGGLGAILQRLRGRGLQNDEEEGDGEGGEEGRAGQLLGGGRRWYAGE